MADLELLTEYLGTMLQQLSDAERRKLEMSIGRKIRASQKTRITRQQNPDGSAFVPRKKRLRDKKNKIKNKMFNVIKNAKYMRVQRTAQGMAIGFTGRIAFIARVHQFGLVDKVDRDGPSVKYDSRELLGFTEEEIKMIEADVLEHLAAK
ncbi:phage virion morphogenesis protein [Acinetobacter schindleri]|uniref:phage virion morphogenesis protein n=1 Tax=Acinetobacter schindleri TaxID=108981 RepID=UPI00209BAADE|nr:phage virion morphogenesis protein [Acinetobacter schindleri]MCO8066811.1 phage virion morphogenesis protein [Acinetobacter schindleri]WDE16893.1 phage virion morphogenesis protein [Acinetobacter schindleri]